MLTFSLLTRASRLWGASLTVVLLSFSGASIIQVRVAAQDFSLLNCATSSSGNPCVLTSQYNPQRTAYNNNETALTSATVGNSGTAVLQQLNLFQVDPTCSGCSNDTPHVTLPRTGCTYAQATFNPIYAQPLYVPGISVASPANTGYCNDGGSGKCNVLIAATLNDTVFAWNDVTEPAGLSWKLSGQRRLRPFLQRLRG